MICPGLLCAENSIRPARLPEVFHKEDFVFFKLIEMRAFLRPVSLWAGRAEGYEVAVGASFECFPALKLGNSPVTMPAVWFIHE